MSAVALLVVTAIAGPATAAHDPASGAPATSPEGASREVVGPAAVEVEPAAPAADPPAPPPVAAPVAEGPALTADAPRVPGRAQVSDPWAAVDQPPSRRAAREASFERERTLTQRLHRYPDRPTRWRLGAQLDGGTATIFSRAYRAFDDERSAGAFGLSAFMDGRVRSSRLFLGGGLGMRRMASEGSPFAGTVSTDLGMQELILFLRPSVVIIDGIDAYLQLGGGPTWASVTSGAQVGWNVVERKVIGTVDALGGMNFYLPKRWMPRRGSSRFTAGVDLGLGYTYRTGFDVVLRPEPPDDPIPSTGTDFGTLGLSSLTWRAGLFVRVI